MRKKETVDYTHASGAERRILLGDLQITKGLFTKVKISILCVCVYVCWEVGLYSSSVAMHPQCVLVALCLHGDRVSCLTSSQRYLTHAQHMCK